MPKSAREFIERCRAFGDGCEVAQVSKKLSVA
jgi:hypothetical protein